MWGRATRTVALLLVVLTAVAVAAACGGDLADGDGARRLSKREYIDRFNVLQRNAGTIFTGLDTALRTQDTAKSRLDALDSMIDSIAELRPPRTWQDEHDTLLRSLRTMRESLGIIARASSRKQGAIAAQVRRYTQAQRDFEKAVRQVNATR